MHCGNPICLWQEDSLVYQGLYIDDYAIGGIVNEEEALNDLPRYDTSRVDKCDQAYHQKGWAPE